MEIMDFNKVQEATDEIQLSLCKLEDAINPDAELDDELVQIVLSLTDEWVKLVTFIELQGRNPADIQSGDRNE